MNNIVNLAIQIIAGIVGALLLGIVGMLIAIIAASIQRNIGFSAENSKKLLHNGIKSAILYQAEIILLVCASGWLAGRCLTDIDFTVLSWVGTAALVFAAEVLICTVLFAVADPRSATLSVCFLKSRLK